MKPAILHVITTIDRGGAENHLLQLASAQAQMGHEVTITYLKGNADLKENFLSAGVKIISGGSNFFSQYLKIHKLARSGRYQIIHAHLPQAELACLGIRNHFISRHNTEPFVPRVPLWFSSLIARVCTYQSTVIAISNAVKIYTQENKMITSNSPISVVYYGINDASFNLNNFNKIKWRKENLHFGIEEFIFGTVSRLVPQKDLTTLISAFSRIAGKRNCKLIIIGDGVQKVELQALVASLNLKDKVIFLGKRNDIPEFLKSIDAFVLTSKYEGLGLVLLEALSAEVPIIAAFNSAIKEIVNEKVAHIFETSSVDALEKAMLDLIDFPDEAKQRAERGKIRVQQNFGVDLMLEGTEKLYLSSLALNQEQP